MSPTASLVCVQLVSKIFEEPADEMSWSHPWTTTDLQEIKFKMATAAKHKHDLSLN